MFEKSNQKFCSNLTRLWTLWSTLIPHLFEKFENAIFEKLLKIPSIRLLKWVQNLTIFLRLETSKPLTEMDHAYWAKDNFFVKSAVLWWKNAVNFMKISSFIFHLYLNDSKLFYNDWTPIVQNCWNWATGVHSLKQIST